MCIINQGYRKEKLNVWENEASHHPQGSAVNRLEALFATMLALLKNISAANVKLKAQEQFVIVTIAHLIKPTACAAWRKKSDRSVVELILIFVFEFLYVCVCVLMFCCMVWNNRLYSRSFCLFVVKTVDY